MSSPAVGLSHGSYSTWPSPRLQSVVCRRRQSPRAAGVVRPASSLCARRKCDPGGGRRSGAPAAGLVESAHRKDAGHGTTTAPIVQSVLRPARSLPRPLCRRARRRAGRRKKRRLFSTPVSSRTRCRLSLSKRLHALTWTEMAHSPSTSSRRSRARAMMASHRGEGSVTGGAPATATPGSASAPTPRSAPFLFICGGTMRGMGL